MSGVTNIGIVSCWSADSVGGLSSYVRHLERGLRAEGVTVTAAARFVSPTPPYGVEYAAVEDPAARSLQPVPAHILRPDPGWLPILKNLNRLVNRDQTRRLAHWLFAQAFAPALQAALPPAMEHLHYVGTGQELLGYAARAEARRRGVGFSVLPAVHPSVWGDGPNDIPLYQSADAVICLSPHERDYLAERGVSRDRLQVSGLGSATTVRGDGAAFRARHGLGDRPLVLFVGRKDRGKGYHALCAAMPLLLKSVPDACLVAAGPDKEPPYPAVPDKALLDLGLADEQEKADALAACDVFCMPSTADSFGIVYVEAWAEGKPVVGGMAPAVRELITENVNGFCVGQDPEAIADVLTPLLCDPALRQRLGDAGRALQQTRYTWPAIVAQHRQVFDAVAADTRKGRTQGRTP